MNISVDYNKNTTGTKFKNTLLVSANTSNSEFNMELFSNVVNGHSPHIPAKWNRISNTCFKGYVQSTVKNSYLRFGTYNVDEMIESCSVSNGDSLTHPDKDGSLTRTHIYFPITSDTVSFNDDDDKLSIINLLDDHPVIITHCMNNVKLVHDIKNTNLYNAETKCFKLTLADFIDDFIDTVSGKETCKYEVQPKLIEMNFINYGIYTISVYDKKYEAYQLPKKYVTLSKRFCKVAFYNHIKYDTTRRNMLDIYPDPEDPDKVVITESLGGSRLPVDIIDMNKVTSMEFLERNGFEIVHTLTADNIFILSKVKRDGRIFIAVGKKPGSPITIDHLKYTCTSEEWDNYKATVIFEIIDLLQKVKVIK